MTNKLTELVDSGDLRQWLGANPTPQILDWYGITAGQWRRWQRLKVVRLPVSMVRLMRYRERCHLAELLGKEWDGWAIEGRCLQIPGLKRALPVNELAGLWLWSSQRAGLENRVKLLERDLAALEAQVEASEHRAAYYRHLVLLEARMGMMLERITP